MQNAPFYMQNTPFTPRRKVASGALRSFDEALTLIRHGFQLKFASAIRAEGYVHCVIRKWQLSSLFGIRE
jgi:hypothetical protein